MLITNIGIVAGFVLVALQLQQNTKAIQIDAREREGSMAIIGEIALMGETLPVAYSKAQLNPEELTDSEIQQVSGYLATKSYAVVQAYDSYKLGLFSRDEWERSKLSYVTEYNYPFARAFLTSVSSIYPPDFIREMEKAYVANPEGELVHLALLKKALALELGRSEKAGE